MDPRFNDSATGNGGQWGEYSFPYLSGQFGRKLGAPRGNAVEVVRRVFRRVFQYLAGTLHSWKGGR